MNYKLLVKLSNIIGVISILLLVYWVFIFISITVFGLKVFQENISETFYLSVIGILALMFGALIINLMFNLTRIAEKHNQDELAAIKKSGKKFGLYFGLSFPLIFGLLFKQTTQEEREFLGKVFFSNYTDIWFNAKDGSYELYHPYIKEGKKIVLYFSDYQRYGRSGS